MDRGERRWIEHLQHLGKRRRRISEKILFLLFGTCDSAERKRQQWHAFVRSGEKLSDGCCSLVTISLIDFGGSLHPQSSSSTSPVSA
jgi:hypothetical protein